MKLNEYLKKIHGSSIFRSVLPVNQGILYPMLSVENGKLCAHFLAHRTEMTKDGYKVFFPEFYMVFTYPGGTLIKFERLMFNKNLSGCDTDSFEVLKKPSAEEAANKREKIGAMLELAEKALADWDENRMPDVGEYNSTYFEILTEKQREVFRKL